MTYRGPFYSREHPIYLSQESLRFPLSFTDISLSLFKKGHSLPYCLHSPPTPTPSFSHYSTFSTHPPHPNLHSLPYFLRPLLSVYIFTTNPLFFSFTYLSQTPSFTSLSRISHENAPGVSFFISSILFSTSGWQTRGLLPPMAPGRILPVSWYLVEQTV